MSRCNKPVPRGCSAPDTAATLRPGFYRALQSGPGSGADRPRLTPGPFHRTRRCESRAELHRAGTACARRPRPRSAPGIPQDPASPPGLKHNSGCPARPWEQLHAHPGARSSALQQLTALRLAPAFLAREPPIAMCPVPTILSATSIFVTKHERGGLAAPEHACPCHPVSPVEAPRASVTHEQISSSSALPRDRIIADTGSRRRRNIF